MEFGFVPDKTSTRTRAKAIEEKTKGKRAESRNLSNDILASQRRLLRPERVQREELEKCKPKSNKWEGNNFKHKVDPNAGSKIMYGVLCKSKRSKHVVFAIRKFLVSDSPYVFVTISRKSRSDTDYVWSTPARFCATNVLGLNLGAAHEIK